MTGIVWAHVVILIVQAVTIVVLVQLVQNVERMLGQLEESRSAREQALKDMRRVADVLEIRTEALTRAREARTDIANTHVRERFDRLDGAIEENTQETRIASAASVEAAAIANRSNEKIADVKDEIAATTSALLEHLKKRQD